MLNTLPFDLPVFEPGTVWLAGAGPGDPGLITLIGAHALRSADVVVYDALVDERLLRLARADAVLEYAGKRGGRPSPAQADISIRLIRHARDGARVLRLKGGDPFVFGRGGEEALSLVAARIPFRIVPGVSSGVGGLAYAGIPVTHRETNSVVSFVTGHGASGELPETIDWKALAASSPVIVLFMALSNLDVIASKLIEAGRSPDEVLAVVSNATLPEQKVVETTLGAAATAVERSGLRPPALVVLGDVVRLRPSLDWLTQAAPVSVAAGPDGSG